MIFSANDHDIVLIKSCYPAPQQIRILAESHHLSRSVTQLWSINLVMLSPNGHDIVLIKSCYPAPHQVRILAESHHPQQIHHSTLVYKTCDLRG